MIWGIVMFFMIPIKIIIAIWIIVWAYRMYFGL